MGAASLFDSVADDLNARSGLDSITAREHALQDDVHLERVLPRELETRGVQEAADVCNALAEAVRRVEVTGTPRDAAPEDIFRRMRDRSPS